MKTLTKIKEWFNRAPKERSDFEVRQIELLTAVSMWLLVAFLFMQLFVGSWTIWTMAFMKVYSDCVVSNKCLQENAD